MVGSNFKCVSMGLFLFMGIECCLYNVCSVIYVVGVVGCLKCVKMVIFVVWVVMKNIRVIFFVGEDG